MAKPASLTESGLEAALELYPDSAIVFDSNLQVRALNRKAERLLAGAQGTLSASRNFDIFSDESKVRFLNWLAHGGSGELTLLVRVGSERTNDWVTITQREVQVEGTPCHLVAMRRSPGPELDTPEDVDEYRRLREAAVSRKVGIYEHDHVTDEIYGNGEVRAQFGLDPTEQLTIGAFAGATHPDDAAYLVAQIAQSHDPEGDGLFDVRLRIQPKSGGLRWIHTCARTRFKQDQTGALRPFLTTGSVIDITHEHSQEEYNRRLAAIMDATPDLVATTDLSGQLTYLNRAGRELLGLRAEQDVSAMHADELFSPTERRRWLREAIRYSIDHGLYQGEAHLSCDPREAVPVSVVLLAHKESRSIGAYLSIIARDQRRQKALEAQLLHSQKVEAIGRLAGGIAHDFNNLLSIIISFASIGLKPKNLPAPTSDSLQEILRAADRAATLTQGLLSFSRKQVLSLSVVDVRQMVEEFKPMLAQLLPERIELVVSTDDLPIYVRANRAQLEQLIMNLVVNARDAIEEHGTISITLSLKEVASHPTLSLGTYAALSVMDTGAGIDEAIQTKVFEPFFTTKPSGLGTGLGLSTVFGIVTQAGGDVILKTEKGRGTTFTVLLPRTLEQTTDKAPLDEGPPPAALTSPRGLILVVEDQAQLRKALITLLSDAGYQTLAPSSPLEALELAAQHRHEISVVLTDVIMPQMNGVKLAEALGARGVHCPILFMSGYTEEIQSHHFPFEEGVNFLSKPVQPSLLLSALGRIVPPG
jgi:PAS domain S-box-containing protein